MNFWGIFGERERDFWNYIFFIFNYVVSFQRISRWVRGGWYFLTLQFVFPFVLIQYLRTSGLPSASSTCHPSAAEWPWTKFSPRSRETLAQEARWGHWTRFASATIHIFVSLSEVLCIVFYILVSIWYVNRSRIIWHEIWAKICLSRRQTIIICKKLTQ